MVTGVFLKEGEEEVISLGDPQANKPVYSKEWHSTSAATDRNVLNFKGCMPAAIG